MIADNWGDKSGGYLSHRPPHTVKHNATEWERS